MALASQNCAERVAELLREGVRSATRAALALHPPI
jgi:hypothetical protein